MSDTSYTDLIANTTWQDAITVYPGIASANSWVQNKSGSAILVAYTANAAAPTTNVGRILSFRDVQLGNAAHIWIKSTHGTSTVALGLQ